MLVGVTGGIGSGKSELAKMLADLGAQRVDADAVAREVVADTEIVASLLAEFGSDLRDGVGQIDRRELGRRALRTAEGSRRLEEIMRTPLAKSIDRRLAAAEGSAGRAIVVYDASLIFEWGREKLCDLVVVVDAAEELRIERVRQRSGMESGEIRERMARQMDPAQKKVRADYVIDNNGDLAALNQQAQGLWAKLQVERGRI